MNPYSERFSLLRASMKENNIDTYLISSTDPHIGEYVPDHWRVIAWLTGFTGSSATIVVTDSFAGLWTDSRYFIQAQDQLLGSGCTPMKPELLEKKDLTGWLSDNINNGSRIAVDGRIFSIDRMRKIEKLMVEKMISFDNNCDLISGLWTDRPPMPDSVAFDHPVAFCGKER
jgi:Xaa-Pro aminopeptidase